MKQVFAFALIASAVGFSTIAAPAMPVGSVQTQDSLIVQVAGGCGVGFHRGPYGGCRRNGWYEGRYWGTPVVAPVVVEAAVVGPCPRPVAHQLCRPSVPLPLLCHF